MKTFIRWVAAHYETVQSVKECDTHANSPLTKRQSSQTDQILRQLIASFLSDASSASLSCLEQVLGGDSTNREQLLIGLRLHYCAQESVPKTLSAIAQSLLPSPPLWVAAMIDDKHNKWGAATLPFADFDYLPIPKNASSTIAAEWVRQTEGLSVKAPHKHYLNPFHATVPVSPPHGRPLFVVLRDPLERLQSYWEANIINRSSLRRKFGDVWCSLPTTPQFTFFLEYLPQYCLIFDDVLHHTLPQAFYIAPYLAEGYRTDCVGFDRLHTVGEKFPQLREGLAHTLMPRDPQKASPNTAQQTAKRQATLPKLLHPDNDITRCLSTIIQ
jgi:hypothetical protein